MFSMNFFSGMRSGRTFGLELVPLPIGEGGEAFSAAFKRLKVVVWYLEAGRGGTIS